MNSWLEIFFPFTQIGLFLFLSVAVDRFAPSHDNRMHALSLRFAKVRRRVQCGIRLLEFETGRRRLQPRRAVCVDFLISATTWFEVPCELYFFQSFFFFFFGVSSTFSSRYLTDRQRAAVVLVDLSVDLMFVDLRVS